MSENMEPETCSGHGLSVTSDLESSTRSYQDDIDTMEEKEETDATGGGTTIPSCGEDGDGEDVECREGVDGVDVSESSESDDDDEEVRSAEAAVMAAPWSYDAHASWVTALRTAGRFRDVRTARQAMAERFPMTPSMWHEWIDDEMKVAFDTAEDRARVSALAQQATQDYLDVDIWLLRIEVELHRTRSGDQSWEQLELVLSDASSRAGLHFLRGAEVWRSYLVGAEELKPDRVPDIVARLLRVPVQDFEDQVEYVQNKYPDILESKQAKIEGVRRLLNDRKALEERVSVAQRNQNTPGLGGADVVEAWEAYVDFEDRHDRARAIVVQERFILDCFLIPDIWLRYEKFILNKVKDISQAALVMKRAIRNCPWSPELHRAMLRAMERNGASDEAIAQALRDAIRHIRQFQYSGVADVCMEVLQRARRLASSSPAGIDHLRTAAHLVLEALDSRDANRVAVLRFLGKACSLWPEAVEDSRRYFEEILSIQGTEVSGWIDFIATEIARGGVVEARKLFNRGAFVLNSTEAVVALGTSWLAFEGLHGTLEGIETAEEKVKRRLNDVQKKRKRESGEPQTSKAKLGVKQDKQSHRQMPKKGKSSHRELLGSGDDESSRQEESNSLGCRVMEPDTAEVDKTTNDGMESNAAQVEAVSTDEAEKETPHSGLLPEAKAEETEPTSSAMNEEPVSRNEKNIVFVSNLNFTTTKETLLDNFVKIPGLKDVRLITRSDGASKGIAYVEFEDAGGVNEALKLHKSMLDARMIWVQKSKPPGPHSTSYSRARPSRGGGRGRSCPGTLLRRNSKPPLPPTPSRFAEDHGGHRRSGLSGFIPRSVRRLVKSEAERSRQDPEGDTVMEHSPEQAEKNLSQEDFRAMLRKS
mmetsp:Transcript_8038/g.16168  ORF Transcript_8038/g.16168 Transcript_8038/m.16168 type:complete len:874 (-) Transcript_8038:90-2711(-)